MAIGATIVEMGRSLCGGVEISECGQCRPAPQLDPDLSSQLARYGIKRRQGLAAAQGSEPADPQGLRHLGGNGIARKLFKRGSKDLVLDENDGRAAINGEVVAQEGRRTGDH